MRESRCRRCLRAFLAAQPKIRLQPAVLQRIDNIVGDPAGHRVHPLPLIEGTLVAKGGAFYVDRTLKAKDRSPADAIPDEGRIGH